MRLPPGFGAGFHYYGRESGLTAYYEYSSCILPVECYWTYYLPRIIFFYLYPVPWKIYRRDFPRVFGLAIKGTGVPKNPSSVMMVVCEGTPGQGKNIKGIKWVINVISPLTPD